MSELPIVTRLRALHVWPQFVADEHAEVILPRQSKGLYEVGEVATEAADRITELVEELEAQADGAAMIITLLANQTGAGAASIRGMLSIQEQTARAALAKAGANR